MKRTTSSSYPASLGEGPTSSFFRMLQGSKQASAYLRSVGLVIFLTLAARSTLLAQPTISYLTPDIAAPGMCVAVEIIAPFDRPGAFGADGSNAPGSLVRLQNQDDSLRIRFGPSVVSWNGRLIQVMVLVEPNASIGWIPLQVVVGNQSSNFDSIHIVPPVHAGALTGGGVIGNGSFGPRSPRNCVIVDSLLLSNGTWTCSQTDPDTRVAGNQAYLPLRILAAGPIRLSNATINVNGGDATTQAGGGVGGPGGGGGGAGFTGSGGDGYTGGGAMGDAANHAAYHAGIGTGSLTGPNYYDGGKSLNNTPGGQGREHNGGSDDEGGGAGTGHPFGTSGAFGIYNANSLPGGHGGASGGGSVGNTTNYGGGGGGYFMDGAQGGGSGNNAGLTVGNAELLPLAGGSGGGSGNVSHFSSGYGGSGGAGGGAVELTSFADFAIPTGSLSAKGGAGSNGTAGTLGLERGAGGGGGSGGAIVVSARDSISVGTPVNFDISGGNGGGGSNNGGKGSVGHIRLNGYVSKVNGNPSFVGYFDPTRDYTGPSIQRVSFTKSTFTVTGFGPTWQNFPTDPQTVNVFYYIPSVGAWNLVTASTAGIPASLSGRWRTAPIAFKRATMDSEIYIVAVAPVPSPATGTPFVDVPAATMSHTSGIIAAVPNSPQAKVAITPIDFGRVRNGHCSRDTIVKVYSIGKVDLLVDPIAITGPDASQFTLRTAIPVTVKPKDSLAVVIAYCPTLLKCPASATLHIVTNDTTFDIPLTGCAIEPAIAAAPLTLDFGSVRVGDCKDSSVVLTNTGTDTLAITSQTIGDQTHITALTPLPKYLLPGASLTLALRFCPTDTAAITTFDSVLSDAPQSPSVLTITGKGKAGALLLPKALDFGEVIFDSCKDSGFYAVNIGTDTLVIGGEKIGSDGGAFSYLSPATPIALGPGDSVLLQFRLCSHDTGSYVGGDTVFLDKNETRLIGSVTLLGHTGFGVLSNILPIDFGSVVVGGCKDTTVVVTNTGTARMVVDSLPGLTTPFTTVSGLPATLKPGESAAITLRYCPQDTIVSSYKADIAIDTPAKSSALSLTGRGIQGALATSGPVDFGCVVVGTSPHRTVKLTNTGSATLVNVGASIAGSPDFQIALQPSGTIAPGTSDSTVISVRFTNFGDQQGSVTLNWSGSTTPITIPVHAHVSPAPAITVLDSNLTFDTVEVGDSSSPKCIRLTNYSCLPISAHDFSLSSSAYEIVSSTNFSLADSSVATVCIRFRPTQNGSDTAKLSLMSGPDTIAPVTLTGTGHSKVLDVVLALDTIYATPGQVIAMPVRIVNEVGIAGIRTITFRVQFDPMQLDLRNPGTTGSTIAANTYSVKKYSLGDQEITVNASAPLSAGTVTMLPFEVLLPSTNRVGVHILSASFATAPATLGSSSDGLVVIQQCDTTERITARPGTIQVEQNEPNPFSSQTTIHLVASSAGHVKITLYDLLGQAVRTLEDADIERGAYDLTTDLSALPNGSYIYVTEWTNGDFSSRTSKKLSIFH